MPSGCDLIDFLRLAGADLREPVGSQKSARARSSAYGSPAVLLDEPLPVTRVLLGNPRSAFANSSAYRFIIIGRTRDVEALVPRLR